MPRIRLRVKCAVVGMFALITAGIGAGEVAAQLLPLSAVPVPRPPNLGDYVRDERAAQILGKALFWDMQVGSDGVQACGSCHFRAGADPRKKNQISPGFLQLPQADLNFDGQGPNYTLRRDDFPFLQFLDPRNRESDFTKKNNNVVSSQGVHYAIYGQDGRPDPDPENFRVGRGRDAANVRRVEPRNTPTMINAVFNHRNFWDMRAQNEFNGVNPFGLRDPNAYLYSADAAGNLEKVKVLLLNSSLASQAVGPPTNRFEMSADGRTFPDVGQSLILALGRQHRDNGRFLRNVVPLAKQLVHREDSLLGRYSRWPLRGLTTSYEALIQRTFHPRWWDSSKLIRVAEDGTTTVVNRRGNPRTDEYTLLEYNFSLFFGLAVQLYEATLISDDTPFDRFLADPVNAPLSAAAERGRQIFMNQGAGPQGACRFCHSGTLLTEATATGVLTGFGTTQSNDRGTRAIGVTDVLADVGAGGNDPFGNPLSIAVRSPNPNTQPAVDGTFKIPSLRNVELTAPYFHNGGERTLLDVVNFYARGGSFGGTRNPIVTRNNQTIVGLTPIAGLNEDTPAAAAARADLVEFLKSLTDERVRRAAAPFDHPQIFVPNGHPGNDRFVRSDDGTALDSLIEIPATGKNGGPVLPGFLED